MVTIFMAPVERFFLRRTGHLSMQLLWRPFSLSSTRHRERRIAYSPRGSGCGNNSPECRVKLHSSGSEPALGHLVLEVGAPEVRVGGRADLKQTHILATIELGSWDAHILSCNSCVLGCSAGNKAVSDFGIPMRPQRHVCTPSQRPMPPPEPSLACPKSSIYACSNGDGAMPLTAGIKCLPNMHLSAWERVTRRSMT